MAAPSDAVVMPRPHSNQQSCCSDLGPWEYTVSMTGADGEKHSLYVDEKRVVLGKDDRTTTLSMELVEPGTVVLGLPNSALHIEAEGGVLRVTDTGQTHFLMERVAEKKGLFHLRTKDGSYLSASEPGRPVSLVAEADSGTCFSFAPGVARVMPRWAADKDYPFDETHSTHLWIFNRAVKLIASLTSAPRNLNALKLCLGDWDFSQAVRQGIYDADNSGVFDVATSGIYYSAHFYNPETKRGGSWDTDPKVNAVEYGVRYLEQSMLDTDPKSCGRKLGLAIHYLEDLTQPMHCHDFPNLPNGYPGFRHSNYEDWTLGVHGSCALDQKDLDPNFVPPGFGEWKDWWEYAAQQGLAEYNNWAGPYSPIGIFAPSSGSSDWLPFTSRMLKLAQKLVACLLLQWAQVSKLVENIGASISSQNVILRRTYRKGDSIVLTQYVETARDNEDGDQVYAHLFGPTLGQVWVLDQVIEGGKPVFEGANAAYHQEQAVEQVYRCRRRL